MTTCKKKAEQGIITSEMETVANYEGVDAEIIRAGIANGSIVIPKNKLKKLTEPRGIGKGLRTKINANIGASPNHSDIELEIAKLKAAVEHRVDAIMDLSLGKDQIEIRKAIIELSPVMVGTVPIYQTGFEMAANRRNISEMSIEDFLATVENQARQGVDFMTIHSGVNRQSVQIMDKQGRHLGITSRGGSFIVSWLKNNPGQEAPLYEYYDEILDILAEYDITISLGDGMRPGTTMDASDRAQISELITLGELTERAWAKGVQVMIEGPGHVPLNKVTENITIQKSLCHNAPFYILGPLVCDIASGYDHIAGAIGATLAAMHGADFLCYLTPAEHLRLPNVDDVIEGVVASRIAAHSADLATGMNYAVAKEKAMARARKKLLWDEQIALAIAPQKARKYREESSLSKDDDTCSMCGEFCAIKLLQK